MPEAEPRGPQRHGLVIQRAAYVHLHPRRRAMGDHGAQVFEHTAERDHASHQRNAGDEFAERGAAEHLGDQPSEQREARHTHNCGGKTHHDGHRDAATHAGREPP